MVLFSALFKSSMKDIISKIASSKLWNVNIYISSNSILLSIKSSTRSKASSNFGLKILADLK